MQLLSDFFSMLYHFFLFIIEELSELAIWFSTTVSSWWSHSVIPFYYDNRSWILFCFWLFVILEIANIIFFAVVKYYLAKYSPIYRKIKEINSHYHFTSIPKTIAINARRNSLQQLRDVSPESYFKKEIKNSQSKLTHYFLIARNNRINYEKYIKELSRIDDSYVMSKVGRLMKAIMLGIEKDCYNQIMFHPITNPTYLFHFRYTSPAGRNSYRKKEWATQNYFEQFYSPSSYHSYTLGSSKNFAENERSKMTKKLRLQVLERDNFTCQFCGRSPQKDGVSLEVDHIIPVSRGGRTELSNLQTLCQDCNRGKSDRFVFCNYD